MESHSISRWGRYGRTLKKMWHYYRGWKWLIFITLSLTLLLCTYMVILGKTTRIETLQDALKSETTIYDYEEQYAGTLMGQKGTYVSLDEIAPIMQETVIKTEDKDFYSHNGFDIQGIGRAFVRLLINRDTSGGGGSTITQQLTKNAFLSLDQTFQRKFKELFLAIEVEKTYSKDQILEMYLNHAYFGNGVWGVEDASQKYFGHSAHSLNANEAAVLTGILKGPSLYNPLDDYAAAIERRNVVLDVMVKQGSLEAHTADEIKAAEIPLYDNFYFEDRYAYPYYFDAVINEANQVTNIPEADLLAKGYKIYTYLNPAYQNDIDQSYQADWIFPYTAEEEPLVQSASIVIDTETSGVAAIYGGRGEYQIRGFNRATDMKRSPGSTIKPLAVYVPALEYGYKMHSQVPDVVKAYGKNKYAPENYDLQTDPSGEVPLYYALAQSKNTSAVYLMDQIGIDKAVNKLEQFGIQVAPQDRNLTLALGAFSDGITVKQLANAYSAFSNNGIRQESRFIKRIEDAQGKVVYENKRPRKYMVMTAQQAADMTSMMLDTFGGYGTGYGAGPSYGLLAGKTGSTEVSEEDMTTRDKWMVGYTPDFVIATWVGLDEVGAISLDELMPSGMGALFNLQTTALMEDSKQTPFKVTYASQTSSDTNVLADLPWEDTAAHKLDEAQSWLQEFWEESKETIHRLSEDLTNLMNEWELPF